jgi:DNA-binding beta-propeller fold protein YncE
VYIFHRGEHPMLIFDREGNYIDTWGRGLFSRAHSVRAGPDGMLYCVDFGDHTVRKMTPEGEVLMTLGLPNHPSDTGATDTDYRRIKRVGEPFNRPTDVAFGKNGDLFVSDGYGNARVHRFSKEGELLASWGEPGSGPGQFHLVHGIMIDRTGRVYIADRENSRIQVFTPDGQFVAEWRDANRPAAMVLNRDGDVAVAEMGYTPDNMYAGNPIPQDRDPFPRMTIRSLEEGGKILAEWGGKDRCAPGGFQAPHMVAMDSRGDLYVAEVTFATKAPAGCHAVQKFIRKP